MQRRLTIIVAMACLAAVLGLIVLQPPATSAVATPRLEASQRFAELLEIRTRRDLTPGEERELRELRLLLLHTLHRHIRGYNEGQWQ
jgi:hypothetical protein